jgi:hypothetical protein
MPTNNLGPSAHHMPLVAEMSTSLPSTPPYQHGCLQTPTLSISSGYLGSLRKPISSSLLGCSQPPHYLSCDCYLRAIITALCVLRLPLSGCCCCPIPCRVISIVRYTADPRCLFVRLVVA